MGCLKDEWKCVHNGSCSEEFYYRIHTFTGAFEIVVENHDCDPTGSKVSLFEEKRTTFPRLVILRPRSLSQTKTVYSTKRMQEYRERRSRNESLYKVCESIKFEEINFETKQIVDFSENCIFEIISEDDLPLLYELRALYGVPELLESVSVEDQNIVGSLLEKDESGILVINPWESDDLNKDVKDTLKTGVNPAFPPVDPNKLVFDRNNDLSPPLKEHVRSNEIDFSNYSTSVLDVFAIFGILSLFEEPFLLVSSDKECSSVIYQGGSYKTINRVTKTLALPLLSCSLEEQFNNQEDQIISKVKKDIPLIFRSDFPKSNPTNEICRNNNANFSLAGYSSGANNKGEYGNTSSNRHRERKEWVGRVSRTLQKMSPIRNKKEAFSSFLGDSSSSWLSNSLINVSTGIIDSVTTALSSGATTGQNLSGDLTKSNDGRNAMFVDNKNRNFKTNSDNSSGGNGSQHAEKRESLESCLNASIDELLAERRATLKLLLEGVTKMISSGGFYFSFDLDLTRTLQKKFENSWKDQNERVGKRESGLSYTEGRKKAYILTGDSRFMWNERISLPVIISGADPRWITPLVQGYFCNQAIVTSPEGPGYVKIGQEILSLRMSMINSFTDIDELECEMQDKLNRKRFVCKMCYEDHVDMLTRYDVVLFSRRSWERGGTRFNARGIDDEANVANFVESELQVCINNTDHWFSFVQIRGSIPLFWEQTGVNSCSITCFDHDYSNYIFEKHHQKLSDIYGQVIYVNLLGSSSHEQSLSMGLKKEINYYNLNLNGKLENTHYFEDSPTGLRCNCYIDSLNVSEKRGDPNSCASTAYCNCSGRACPIIYKCYDYHQQTKNFGFENALNTFVSQLAKEIGARIGYFYGVFKQGNTDQRKEPNTGRFRPENNINSVTFANLLNLDDFESSQQTSTEDVDSDDNSFVILERQKGVIRTNCLDCLDRTNALQWYVAWTWFVDLVISISTNSIGCELDRHLKTVNEEVNYEYFMNALINSQLTHFGWFGLNPKQLRTQFNDDECLFFGSEKNSHTRLSLSGKGNDDLSNTINPSQVQGKSAGDLKSSASNPKASLKSPKNDFESNDKSNTNALAKNDRSTPRRGDRHSFLLKRKSDFLMMNNTNTAPPIRPPTSLINMDGNAVDIEPLPSSYNSSKNASSKINCVFKKCLLNGMGIVTLKDSFSLLWAENGDVISELYTGAGSVFSGLIKNRKVSLSTNFDHALKSLRRLYHNTFEDSSRQQYIDCLLYRHPVNSNLEVSLIKNMINLNIRKHSTNHINLKGDNYEKLTIWVGTWNLAGQNFQAPINHWVKANFNDNTSIVCFCLQELVELSGVRVMFNQNDKNREASFELKAIATLGDEYVKLHSTSLVGLFCIVFIRKPLYHFVKSVESSSLKLGLMGNTGNKGAVVVRVNFHRFGTVAFTNVHLSSGEQNHEDRISQLKIILQTQIFTGSKQSQTSVDEYLKHGNSLLDHDFVVLAGDFNFRIQIPKQEAFELLQAKKYKELINHDQFVSEKSSNTDPFDRLYEESISFLPTYKFAIGEHFYDQSRTPSWCDRILIYKSDLQVQKKQTKSFKDVSITVNDYKSDPRYYSSDHQPVSATITLKFFH
ncbi:phosphatidylinositol phosphate phosphatase [Cryptosporidium ryanae]|uniref:phosphatidylinositol phosphate phosphatase n=1 Tax=Cryptosporidium ryanae TaxID=515981 RepID=UPI00351A9E57|nr:phosphatidylinositol phosphate phosphatase [Cryptosporidium ryanae]